MINLVSFDTETFLIAPGRQAPPPVVMSLATTGGGAHLVPRAEIVPVFRGLLESPHVPLLGHNVAYDMVVLAAEEPDLLPLIFDAYDAQRVFDTGIRQKLLDNAHGVLSKFYFRDGKAVKVKYALDELVRRVFRVDLDKDTWRLRYGEIADVPLDAWPQGAREYALDDARWPLKLFAAQEDERHHGAADFLDDQHRQVYYAFALELIQCWGLITDPRTVDAFEGQLRGRHDELLETLLAAKLITAQHKRVKVSPTPKGRKVEYIFVPEGYKREEKFARTRVRAAYEATQRPVPLTDTGEKLRAQGTTDLLGYESLDEEACRSSGDPALVVYGEFSSLIKQLSTDVPLVRSGTVAPIHAHFDTILATGRTSTSPNIQNLPTTGHEYVDEAGDKRHLMPMRECFVPRPGCVFADVDYAVLELCTVAQVLLARFGKSKLADAINGGIDPHLGVAAQIVGCTYEEAHARKKAGDKEVKRARDLAKVANYGFPGGLGADRFVVFAAGRGVTVTKTEAAKLKRTFLEAWPEFRDYFAWIAADVERPKARVRQLYSNRWHGGVTYTEAANGYFQGLGSDIAKSAGVLLARACYLRGESSVLYGSRVVNFIHDEYLVEVPEPIGHECAFEVADIMRRAARPWLPDVKLDVGEPVLMRRWSKDAVPVWDGDRLVPWS